MRHRLWPASRVQAPSIGSSSLMAMAAFLVVHFLVIVPSSVQGQSPLTRQHLKDRDNHLRNPPRHLLPGGSSRNNAAAPSDRERESEAVQRFNYFTSTMDDQAKFRQILDQILIVRVPDTPGIKRVRNFIMGSMQGLGWSVTEDRFKANTPDGRKEFVNVIATLDPQAPRRLILACHYDSKKNPKDFLGATDSAVPCAQMIHLAAVMDKDLKDLKNREHAVTLQLVFFDGEEPFVRWAKVNGITDNTYGSRHLAAVWQKGERESRQEVPLLKGIDALVLLDLLGAKNPTIQSLDPATHEWYKHFGEIEALVKAAEPKLPQSTIFEDPRFFGSPGNTGIEDDHIPFMAKGVNILHLIAAPFPKVWHTEKDNRSAIHYPTVWKLNRIFRVFVAQYLKL